MQMGTAEKLWPPMTTTTSCQQNIESSSYCPLVSIVEMMEN